MMELTLPAEYRLGLLDNWYGWLAVLNGTRAAWPGNTTPPPCATIVGSCRFSPRGPATTYVTGRNRLPIASMPSPGLVQ